MKMVSISSQLSLLTLFIRTKSISKLFFCWPSIGESGVRTAKTPPPVRSSSKIGKKRT